MGCNKHIDYDRYPEQYKDNPSGRVMVCFGYKTDRELPATVIRDDAEDPGLTILMLDDGRVVTSTECQYRAMTPQERKSRPKPDRMPVYTGIEKYV